MQIFFVLVASIALKYDPATLQNATNMDALHSIVTFVPFAVFLYCETPLRELVQGVLSKYKIFNRHALLDELESMRLNSQRISAESIKAMTSAISGKRASRRSDADGTPDQPAQIRPRRSVGTAQESSHAKGSWRWAARRLSRMRHIRPVLHDRTDLEVLTPKDAVGAAKAGKTAPVLLSKPSGGSVKIHFQPSQKDPSFRFSSV